MIRAALMLAITAAAVPAQADPFDEFGMGARSAGMAGAYAAEARGADAAHHNPAAVALAEHPSVLLGYGFGTMQLDINGADAKVLDARGGQLGIAIPVKHGAVTYAFGLSLYLPDQFIARVQLVPATEPHFGLLDNDPHRLVVEPVMSVKIGDYVAFGAGASLLTDAAGNGITFNVGVEAGEKVGEAALDVEMPTRAAPLLGVLITPTPRVRLATTYRGELSLDLALDILANVDVASVVTGDALVSVRATNYYTPRRVTGGVAVDVFPDLTLSGEFSWADWSAHPGLVADLRVLVNLDTAPPLTRTDITETDMKDTVTARIGSEWRFGTRKTRFALRTGYAFVPTPVPDQTGLTSIADNDRHILALGFGVTLADWKPTLTRPISFALATQWHRLSNRLTLKDAALYPGNAFSSGGNIFYVGSTMTVDF